jgi:NADPH-dependent 2,4-dienoyl-CoA reductase/sulfur reductase-like enzyme
MRIVVIGGVAAGMSAASQAKRRRPDAEVIVLERGPHVSYGACGMPYNIEDPARALEDLVVITAEQFRAERGIDVRTMTEALAVDPERKRVHARDRRSGSEIELDYDALVIATGASAVRPPLRGLDLPGVFVLRELTDGIALKRYLAEARPQRAVILGAGYIGLEMAEVLRARGLGVVLLERERQVLPGYEDAVVKVATETLHRHEVEVHPGATVDAIERTADGRGLVVRGESCRHEAELVLVSVGVRPNVALARDAGIRLGDTGAIAVDAELRTSAPDVFAAGDCAEAPHLISGRPAYIPLGTTANKQGKIAGANAAGAHETFAGIVGSAGFKLFELEVARTGLSSLDARRLGLDAVAVPSTHRSRAHGYPGAKPITTVLVVERGTRRLLGAQMIGGDAVAKRVDVLATALHARMTIDQVEALDLSYAPPFAPVWDPILIAATVAAKAVAAPRGGRGS